jgi:hypothetical protein
MGSRNPDFGGKKGNKKGTPSKTRGARKAAPGERIAAAWAEWIGSEEGKGCARFATLGSTSHPEPYLYNRLWRAFIAGAKRPVARRAKGSKSRPSLGTSNDRFVRRKKHD